MAVVPAVASLVESCPEASRPAAAPAEAYRAAVPLAPSLAAASSRTIRVDFPVVVVDQTVVVGVCLPQSLYSILHP